MRRVMEVFGLLDLAVTIWWVAAHGNLAPGLPTLPGWGMPCPGWLWGLLWTLLAALAAGVTTMVGLCVQVVVQPRG